MKRITALRGRVVMLLVLAALVLVGVVTVTASAVIRRVAAPPTPVCSLASVAGGWGHNFDGWTNNGVLSSFAGAGTMAVDGQGNVSGTEMSTLFAGPAIVETVTGTLSVNADCTGTLALTLADDSGRLPRTEAWAVVFVDNETVM